MRISDWSSDVCSSDLNSGRRRDQTFRKSARDHRRSVSTGVAIEWHQLSSSIQISRIGPISFLGIIDLRTRTAAYCRPESGDKMSRQFQAKISTVAVRESFEVTVTANNALHAKKIIEGQHGKVKTWWRGDRKSKSLNYSQQC